MLTRLRRLVDRVRAVLHERELAAHREINELVRAVEDAAPEGVVSCDACGMRVAPRGNHYSVHFPSITSDRPCSRSWPPATTRSIA